MGGIDFLWFVVCGFFVDLRSFDGGWFLDSLKVSSCFVC